MYFYETKRVMTLDLGGASGKKRQIMSYGADIVGRAALTVRVLRTANAKKAMHDNAAIVQERKDERYNAR